MAGFRTGAGGAGFRTGGSSGVGFRSGSGGGFRTGARPRAEEDDDGGIFRWSRDFLGTGLDVPLVKPNWKTINPWYTAAGAAQQAGASPWLQAPLRVGGALSTSLPYMVRYPRSTGDEIANMITGVFELPSAVYAMRTGGGFNWRRGIFEPLIRGGGDKGMSWGEIGGLFADSVIEDYKTRYGSNWAKEAEKRPLSNFFDLLSVIGVGMRGAALASASSRLKAAGLPRHAKMLWQESARPGIHVADEPYSRTLRYQPLDPEGKPLGQELEATRYPSRSPLRRGWQEVTWNLSEGKMAQTGIPGIDAVVNKLMAELPKTPLFGARARTTSAKANQLKRAVDRVLGAAAHVPAVNALSRAELTRLYWGSQLGDHSPEMLRSVREVLDDEYNLPLDEIIPDQEFQDWVRQAKQQGFGPLLIKNLDAAIADAAKTPDEANWTPKYKAAELAMREMTNLSEEVIRDADGFTNLRNDLTRAVDRLALIGDDHPEAAKLEEQIDRLRRQLINKQEQLDRTFGQRRGRIRGWMDRQPVRRSRERAAWEQWMRARGWTNDKIETALRIGDMRARIARPTDPQGYWRDRIGAPSEEGARQFMERGAEALAQSRHALIPDDISAWTRWGDNVELTPVLQLRNMMDAVDTLDEGKIEKLMKDISENGVKEPLIVDFAEDTKMAYLSEGNNRLEALRRLGHNEAPTRVIRVSHYAERHGGRPVNPEPYVDEFGEVHDDYIPQYTSPSQIGLMGRKWDEPIPSLHRRTAEITGEQFTYDYSSEKFKEWDGGSRIRVQAEDVPEHISEIIVPVRQANGWTDMLFMKRTDDPDIWSSPAGYGHIRLEPDDFVLYTEPERMVERPLYQLPGEVDELYPEGAREPAMPKKLKTKGITSRVYDLIKQGAPYRDWYERGAAVIKDLADRQDITPAQAAAVVAITSQQANPTFNLRRAAEIIAEWKSGEGITKERYFAGQAEKVDHVLSNPETFNWAGLKTNSYFANFLEELDPAFYERLFGKDAHKVTVDRHIANMILGKKSVTDAQYEQVAQLFTDAAAELGWKPKEVQAAAWVPWKAQEMGISEEVKALGREMTKRGEVPEELMGKAGPVQKRRAAFVREEYMSGRRAEGYRGKPVEHYIATAADAYERGQEQFRGVLYQGAPEPPVPEGHVRLYRGEQAGEGVEGLAGKPGGRWFTPDREFAAQYGHNGILRYVDVPEDEARQYLTGTLKNPPSHVDSVFHPDAGSEFELPEELAARAETWNPRGEIDYAALPKGATEFLADGNTAIRMFEDGDLSTWIHELGHVAVHDLDGPDLRVLENEFAGGKAYAEWTREENEAFARAWERYFVDGIAPSAELEGVFKKIAKWMKAIWEHENLNVPEISDDVRRTFDALLVRHEPKVFIPHRAGAPNMTGARTSRGIPRAARAMGDWTASRIPMFKRNNMALVKGALVNDDPRLLIEHMNRVVMLARANQLRETVLQMGEPLKPGREPDFDTQYVVKKFGRGVDDVTYDALERVDNPNDVARTVEKYIDDNITDDRDKYESWLEETSRDRQSMEEGYDPRWAAWKGEDQLYVVDKKVVDMLFKNVTGKTPGATTKPEGNWSKALDTALDTTRAMLLYANPGFYVANILGNTVMAGMMNPAAYKYVAWSMNEARKAATNEYSASPRFHNIASEMGRGPTAGGLSQEKGPQIVGRNQGWRDLPAEFKERGVGGVFDSVSQGYSNWGRRSGHIIDDAFRVSAWRATAAKHGVKTDDQIDQLFADARGSTRKLMDVTEEKGPQGKAHRKLNAIRDEAEQLMLDFDSMTPFEKTWLTRAIFLYPFVKASTKYPFMYAGERPITAAAVGGTAVRGQEFAESEEALGPRPDLPAWLRLAARGPGGELWNVGSLSPMNVQLYETLMNLGQKPELGTATPFEMQNPFTQMMVLLAMGRTGFGTAEPAQEIIRQEFPAPAYVSQNPIFGWKEPSQVYADRDYWHTLLRAARGPFRVNPGG